MPQRVGILGGTFDPIHKAHLECAERVYHACNLDHVLFLPAAVPVFKKNQQVTDGRMRKEMCEGALQDKPHFSLCTLELERQGDTYTVDTLEDLTSRYPDVTFFFIVGMDALVTLPLWKDADRLAQLAQFVGVTRPGYEFDAAAQRRLDERGFRYEVVEIEPMTISSTQIRQRVAQGLPIEGFVPDAVCAYIAEKGLYRTSPQVCALH